MKKEFKVQAISEKVEVLEVNGQDAKYNCLHNCNHNILVGNSSTRNNGCRYEKFTDAYMEIQW